MFGRDNDKTIIQPKQPEPEVVAWYGNYKYWLGAALVLILGLLVYVSL